MKLLKSHSPKGATNMYYVALGILIALLIIVSVKYYNDHKNDITVHPPHIEVH